jgi:hypothetical protein
VLAKGKEIETLSAQLYATADKSAVQAQIKKLTTEQGEARISELKAIEWKPLWGKPAIFAGAVLILFVLLFKNPKRTPNPDPA